MAEKKNNEQLIEAADRVPAASAVNAGETKSEGRFTNSRLGGQQRRHEAYMKSVTSCETIDITGITPMEFLNLYGSASTVDQGVRKEAKADKKF